MHVWSLKERLTRILSIFLATVLSLVVSSPQAFAYGGVERIGGQDRYDTMRLIVGGSFESSDWAVVASGDRFSDALCASALAGARKCPVILTSSDSLSPQASSELDRLQVKSVYLMGGTSAISTEVENAIKAKGISCTRVAGADRQATSLEALMATFAAGSTSDTVIVATGLGFADALAIAPWAWHSASSIVLTGSDGTLAPSIVDAIKENSSIKRVLIVGGTAVVSDGVKTQLGDGYAYERLAGADRYATSVEIATWACAHGLSWKSPGVTTGSTFSDALAAAAMLGKKASPLLLASDQATGVLRTHASEISSVTILGGEAAVSAAYARSIADAVASAAASSTTTSSTYAGGSSYGGSSWGGQGSYAPRTNGGQGNTSPAPYADDEEIVPMEEPDADDEPLDLWPDEEDVVISGFGQDGRTSQLFFAETPKGSVAPELFYYADNDYDDELVELAEMAGEEYIVGQGEAPASTSRAQSAGSMTRLADEEVERLSDQYGAIDPATHDYWKVEFSGLPKDEQTFAFYAVAGSLSSETVHIDYWLPFDGDEQSRIAYVDGRICALMGEDLDLENPYNCDYWLNYDEDARHAKAKALLDELERGEYVEEVVDEEDAGCFTFIYVNDVTNPEEDERGIVGTIEYRNDVDAYGTDVGGYDIDEAGLDPLEGDAAPSEEGSVFLQSMGETLQAQAQTKGRVLVVNCFPRFEKEVSKRLGRMQFYQYRKTEWSNMGYQVTLWDRNITVGTYKYLARYDMLVIATHGGEYTYKAGPKNNRKTYSIPAFCVAQVQNDKLYTRELKDHQIVKAVYGYKILPRFFKANYQNNAFRNSHVVFDSCSMFGRNGRTNQAMSGAFRSKGAVSVIGFRDTVTTYYAKAVVKEYAKHLLSGTTVATAFKRTQTNVGATSSRYYGKNWDSVRSKNKLKYDCLLCLNGYEKGGILYYCRKAR